VPPGGGRVRTQTLAQGVITRFPTSPSDPLVPGPSAGGETDSGLNSPGAHRSVLVSMPTADAVGETVGNSVARGHSLPGGGSDQRSPSVRPAFVGMAPEREHLEGLGLSQDVVSTIQGSRAASTRASYTANGQRSSVGV